jgi:hypothetical protein
VHYLFYVRRLSVLKNFLLTIYPSSPLSPLSPYLPSPSLSLSISFFASYSRSDSHAHSFLFAFSFFLPFSLLCFHAPHSPRFPPYPLQVFETSLSDFAPQDSLAVPSLPMSSGGLWLMEADLRGQEFSNEVSGPSVLPIMCYLSA